MPRVVAGGTPTFPVYATTGHARPGMLARAPASCTTTATARASPTWPASRPAALLLTRVISRPTPTRVTLDLGYKAVASDPPAGKRLRAAQRARTTSRCCKTRSTSSSRRRPRDSSRPATRSYAMPARICPTVAVTCNKSRIAVEGRRSVGPVEDRVARPHADGVSGTRFLVSGVSPCIACSPVPRSRRVAVRGLAADTPAGFVPLFNGKDLTGWKATGKMDVWAAEDGVIVVCKGGGGGWLLTEKEYGDFEFRCEYRWGRRAATAASALRDAAQGRPGLRRHGDPAHRRRGLAEASSRDYQHTGSIYDVQPAKRSREQEDRRVEHDPDRLPRAGR